MQPLPDLLQIRTPGVAFYALRSDPGIHLIDAGFWGGVGFLEEALARHDWLDLPILGVLLTHGHLDHILNAKRIADRYQAWVAAPRLDAAHYQGRPRYRGLSQVTGYLEKIGRPLLGFKPFVPGRLIDDGDSLNLWHGLQVVSLPGHTPGHCGYYCEARRLMFSADTFASYRWSAHYPPAIFNHSSKQAIKESAAKVLSFDLDGALPNHCDRSSPQTHLARLRKLVRGSET